MGRRQEGLERLDRSYGVPRLSAGVEAVRRSDRSMQQCPSEGGARVSIENVKDVAQTVAFVLGSLSLVVATIAYLLSRKGLQFNVMIACIQRFQDLLPSLDGDDLAEGHVRQYLDLCNEELFYFQKNYLRKEVALEWIEGMLRFLPLINEDTKSPWDGTSYLASSDKLIHQFPRVAHAFSTATFPDLATQEARRRYVERILNRARRYHY